MHERLDPTAGRVTLRRVPINAGGYDAGGAYWGLGAPLYWAAQENGASLYLRAGSREGAKGKLRAKFGALRFLR